MPKVLTNPKLSGIIENVSPTSLSTTEAPTTMNESVPSTTETESENSFKPDMKSGDSPGVETNVTISSTTQIYRNENTNDVFLNNDDDENDDEDESVDNNEADNDENNESNDLTIVPPDVKTYPIQRPEDCGTDRGGCDHECRILFDDPNDRVGRKECSCRSGFSLDDDDQRTCHGKFESLHGLFNPKNILINNRLYIYTITTAHTLTQLGVNVTNHMPNDLSIRGISIINSLILEYCF